MDTPELVELLENGGQEDIRSRIFTLEGDNLDEQPLFSHQMESVESIYENNNRPGIVRYPTGGGKTRTAIAYMSRERERANQPRKFIWATYPTDVLRQGMLRVAELAGEFSDDTTMAWFDSDMYGQRDLLEKVDILFCMRDHFSGLLEKANDGRVSRNAAMLRVFDADEDEEDIQFSLIYDECHQLGAQKLQYEWLDFHTTYCSDLEDVSFEEDWDEYIHTIGLSATPVPTKPEQCILLSELIFPLGEEVRGDRPEWQMLCHHDVRFTYLQKQGVLSKVDNESWEERDAFNIEFGSADIKPLPPNPTKQQINDFAEQFNSSYMQLHSVTKQLADDIADNIDELGKTLVFVPTIKAANRLIEKMENNDELNGRCTMVHSKLSQFESEDESDVDILDRQKQIQKFKERKDNCVMVNVGMLTTGFDAPDIETVVLARLTTSTNLFWQMLGRGMRGPAVGGTKVCTIIDPIKLTRKHEAMEGYKASIEDAETELLEQSPEDFVEPEVITVDRAEEVPSQESVDADVAESVRRALSEFVSYQTWRDAIRCDSSHTARGWAVKLIEKAERDMDASLEWMRSERFLPSSEGDLDLRSFHRKVEVCKARGIETEEQWKQYLIEQI